MEGRLLIFTVENYKTFSLVNGKAVVLACSVTVAYLLCRYCLVSLGVLDFVAYFWHSWHHCWSEIVIITVTLVQP